MRGVLFEIFSIGGVEGGGGGGGGGGWSCSVSIWFEFVSSVSISSSSLISPSSSSGGVFGFCLFSEEVTSIESRLWLSSFSGVRFDSLLLEVKPIKR